MSRTFGETIRAARLRFHWHDAFGCYLRVSGHEHGVNGPFLIELVPGGAMAAYGGRGRKKDEREFTLWWTDGGTDVLAQAPGLAAFRAEPPTRPLLVYLDGKGERCAVSAEDAR